MCTRTRASPALVAPTGEPRDRCARWALPWPRGTRQRFPGSTGSALICQSPVCTRGGAGPARPHGGHRRKMPHGRAVTQCQHPRGATVAGCCGVPTAAGPTRMGCSHPAAALHRDGGEPRAEHPVLGASCHTATGKPRHFGVQGGCWGPRLETGGHTAPWSHSNAGYRDPLHPGVPRWCRSPSASQPSRFGSTGAASCPTVLPAAGGAGCSPPAPVSPRWGPPGSGCSPPPGLDLAPLQPPG